MKKMDEGRNTTHLGHSDEYDIAETFKMGLDKIQPSGKITTGAFYFHRYL